MVKKMFWNLSWEIAGNKLSQKQTRWEFKSTQWNRYWKKIIVCNYNYNKFYNYYYIKKLYYFF